jgi:hypothetical protein
MRAGTWRVFRSAADVHLSGRDGGSSATRHRTRQEAGAGLSPAWSLGIPAECHHDDALSRAQCRVVFIADDQKALFRNIHIRTGIPGLDQVRASMVTEGIGRPDVASDPVHPLMPADIHHLKRLAPFAAAAVRNPALMLWAPYCFASKPKLGRAVFDNPA